ncbi:MAG: site-specific DNA-methyltransferase [Methylococcales bacterium]|nr:site-specific DNA-methyltransferase [Methylococcales bacterium]
MPTLNWIGKAAVEKHHQDVPYRLLEAVPELSCGVSDSGNLIVQGDNLHALKALLPRYAGQVKCIYIDPPYNTGNEGWVYNDNVNSPEIRKWLGAVVGKEGETLDRHDRWLCMMYPRLLLLREFLREDGVIFVSIGDDELPSLTFLLDEIFGRKNQAAIFVWKSRVKPANVGTAKLKPQRGSEYVLTYSKFPDAVSYNLILSGRLRSYPHKTEDGRKYRLQTILKSNRGENQRDTMRFAIAGFTPPQTQRWQGGEDFIQDLYSNNYLEFRKGIPFRRYFEDEEPSEHSPFYTFIQPEDSGTAESGKNRLNEILGNTHGFDTVKPIEIIERLLMATTKNDDIILDSFAGSGTTAHALLNLNKQDGGNRKFILVEMDETIATTVTAERNKRVIEGYNNAKGEPVEGLGGGFQFYRLSKEPLFTADGQVNADVTFSQLAEFVWLTETKTGYTGKADSPLLGEFNGRAIYLLYNGILGDKDPDKGNVLTPAIFKSLPVFQGQKIIYATAKRGGDSWLKREQIIVKQTPYALRV